MPLRWLKDWRDALGMTNKVRKIVEMLPDKLKEEGIDRVHAWFSGMPHILVRHEADKRLYKVLMWREGAALEIDVDEEGNVKHVYVKTAFS
jgi:hypothetical protein